MNPQKNNMSGQTLLREGAMNRNIRGFTLIELMIVIAVLGIIAAIAYPSFIGQIQKSRRADAKQSLLDVAAKLEVFYQDHKGYPTASNMALLGYTGATFTSPDKHYTIGFSAVPTATSYSIQAIPAGAQVAETGCGAGDSCCGTFQLNHLGEKTVTGATLPADRCW
jgi:type IV pilus assembly protein PilE